MRFLFLSLLTVAACHAHENGTPNDDVTNPELVQSGDYVGWAVVLYGSSNDCWSSKSYNYPITFDSEHRFVFPVPYVADCETIQDGGNLNITCTGLNLESNYYADFNGVVTDGGTIITGYARGGGHPLEPNCDWIEFSAEAVHQ